MADTEWKLQAIHQQFDVLSSLKQPYYPMDVNQKEMLTELLQKIIKQHLCYKTKSKSVYEISSRINRNVIEGQGQFEFSFVVIVMNLYENGKLGKIPIFAIKLQNKTQFIDMNNSIYKTWDSFLKTNDLPACQICFPVNGQYNVGGSLKVDFAKSPSATQLCVRNPSPSSYVVSKAIVASTFFLKIPITMFNCCYELVSQVACNVTSGISKISTAVLLSTASVIQKFKYGVISTAEFLSAIYSKLLELTFKLKTVSNEVWIKIRRSFAGVYFWINTTLSEFLTNSSDTVKHRLLAIICRADNALIDLGLKKRKNIDALTEGKANEKNVYPEPVIPLEESGFCKNEVDSSLNEQITDAKTIFGKCLEYSSNTVVNEKSSNKNEEKDIKQTLSIVTEKLLLISKKIAHHLQCKSAGEVSDIFESIQSKATEIYTSKTDEYMKTVSAAIAAAGHDINIDVFNKNLGISGNPADYYWDETMKCLNNNIFSSSEIKKKILELQTERKIILIPLLKDSEENITGIYKIIGIQGFGKISVSDLLNELKGLSINLDKNNVEINETNYMIVIRSKHFVISAIQELDEENTSEGYVRIEPLKVNH